MPVSNIENLSNRSYGNIAILNIVSSSPRKYACECKRCKASFNMTHQALRTRLDANSPIACPANCTSPIAAQQAREKQYFQDLKQKERAAKEAEEDRILREKYGAKPEPPAPHKPSLEQLDSEFQKTASELARAERQRIIDGLPDPDFVPDPRYDRFSLPTEQVDDWNNNQAEIFMQECPDYYAVPQNSETLLSYIWAQGVRLISAETFRRAYKRLKEFNLLEERPPEPKPAPEPTPSMQHELYPTPARRPQLIDGWDLQTGEPRQYTPYELDRLPSDTLRRVLRIPTAPIMRPREV